MPDGAVIALVLFIIAATLLYIVFWIFVGLLFILAPVLILAGLGYGIIGLATLARSRRRDDGGEEEDRGGLKK